VIYVTLDVARFATEVTYAAVVFDVKYNQTKAAMCCEAK